MSRLTKKFNDNSGYEVKEYGTEFNEVKLNAYLDAVDKLGKLEDLEEQLGCPLEVVVKALEYGIYAKDLPREELSKQFVRLSNVETEWYLINNIMCVNLKDYKISFWLKEDKSE